MGTDHSGSPERSTLSDRVHTALAADDRRAVLRYFDSSGDDTASLDELIEFLHASDAQPDDRNQIAVRLHHAALPKLADLGLLDYDPRTKTVRYYSHPLLSELLDGDAERVHEEVR